MAKIMLQAALEVLEKESLERGEDISLVVLIDKWLKPQEVVIVTVTMAEFIYSFAVSLPLKTALLWV